MNDIAELSARDVRRRIRSGVWTGGTTGAALGYVQANLVALPAEADEEFTEFCAANPQPLPLLEKTRPGVAGSLSVAPDADLRTDLPSYDVHRDGELDERVGSLLEAWRDDFVAYLLGCSFTAENQLARAGVRLRHLELGQGVPMFTTNLECSPVGRFRGPIVVSMRPIAEADLDRAVEVTRKLPIAHGEPLHIGDPAGIGVADLAAPDWGDAIEVEPGEVPVFWACGVTPQAVIRTVRPELAITHTPGHMFVTDLLDREMAVDADEDPAGGD